MYYLFNENVSISKTEFESVEINVLDTDPETAKNIVNSIIDFYNEKVRTMHKLKLMERINVSRIKVQNLTHIKDSLQREINNSNKNYTVADDQLVTNNFGTKSKQTKGTSSFGNKIISKSKQTNRIKEQGTNFYFLTNMFGEVSSLILNYELGIEQDIVEYNKQITYATVVTRPFASDKKFSPKRIPITLLGGLSVFALVILIIGVVENKKHNL
jgi:hypothetical protein